MKSLFQTLIVLAVLFVGYLYIIHDSTDAESLIADLEARAGRIDVQERKLEDLKNKIYGEMKKFNSGSKAEIDSLSQTLEKLNQDLAYNQKVRRLNESKRSFSETLTFDSTKIIPFEEKISRIEKRLEALAPTGLDDLKTEIKEELRTLLEQKNALSQLIVDYSSFFFEAPATGGRVTIENGLDAYGRPAKNKDQFNELSDLIFGKSSPTAQQKETFRQFHKFWCDLPGEQSSNVCTFPWLSGD